MERKILHIDVNNAFLSWSAVDMLNKGYETDIREIPAIIGGDETKRKGIVLAKSMPAKKMGVVTGEPIYMAKKKCPRLVVFPSNYKMYLQYSNELYQLLLEYTDRIERFSIDECFLDLTHFLKEGETLLDKAKEISNRVKQELRFTVNIGISTNKLLAKMASDFEKPDKIHTLYKEEISQKMWKLPASELFMLGRKSVPKLKKMGIHTIGDIAKKDIDILINNFGKHGRMMWNYANGIDDSEVIYEEVAPKCIGNSITLPYDISKTDKLMEILLALTEQVTYRLRKHELLAGSVNVQIKTNEFKTISHQRKLPAPTDRTKEIYEVAKTLLEEIHKAANVRLIGVRVDNLCDKSELQLSFFDTGRSEKQQKIDKTMDNLKKKYGYNSITRAGELNASKMLNLKEE